MMLPLFHSQSEHESKSDSRSGSPQASGLGLRRCRGWLRIQRQGPDWVREMDRAPVLVSLVVTEIVTKMITKMITRTVTEMVTKIVTKIVTKTVTKIVTKIVE